MGRRISCNKNGNETSPLNMSNIEYGEIINKKTLIIIQFVLVHSNTPSITSADCNTFYFFFLGCLAKTYQITPLVIQSRLETPAIELMVSLLLM